MFVIPRTKHIASRMLDLPEPFKPVMALNEASQPVIWVRTGYDLNPRKTSNYSVINERRVLPSIMSSSIRIVVRYHRRYEARVLLFGLEQTKKNLETMKETCNTAATCNATAAYYYNRILPLTLSLPLTNVNSLRTNMFRVEK